ncbi:hypothetical protein [Streptomyces sp. NBC_01373]|uniref:hypothetical protein n=1 Tax=Streptomyces sp. NBC_01373 TaxID=2903843 RepID=UPI0022557613|nr:hypothetical protein [Streptomyces sp. NBC_01373]MCX4697012.1 hypothetical protein [Streptomyces sp. NBC_01373]MCX4707063.1 hypothetical protein [Streptomyces sp. NBC_01373]
MKNKRVINTGTTGHVQDQPGDDIDDTDAFTAGMDATGTGVVNTGVTGPIQNASGTGNTQNITYRNR